MNGIKLFILLMALSGVSMWTLPATLSLFENDHGYYNGSAPCVKCHEDILTQLLDSGNVTAIHRTLDNNSGCKACHANPNNTIGRNATQDHHTAYKPYCIECHQNATNITKPKEAHKTVVSAANESALGLGYNEACELCHTTVTKTIKMENRRVFAFENDSIAANNTPEFNGSYIITISNPAPTGLHNFNSGVSCIMCHPEVPALLNRSESDHRRFGCAGCHRGSGDHVGQTNETRTDYHSAKTKYCSDCHGRVDYPRDCNQCHDSHGGFKQGAH